MDEEDTIRRIVQSVLEKKFDDVEIVRISVSPEIDEDGDRIAVIEIVFDGQLKSLDSRKTTGLARHIIPALREAGESAFPVFSFVAKTELEKRKPAAA